MRLSKRKRSTSAAMDITPMIDITFLLLIFFITVTQVSNADKENIDLPEEEAGEEDDQIANLTINVTTAGEIIVLGKQVGERELVDYVGTELRGVGDDPNRLKILIRASRTGDSRKVNEIVTWLQGMGLKFVEIGVVTTSYD
jgi:biopolymer transport protein ExbD